MGHYTLFIEATGNASCKLNLGDGVKVFGCGQRACAGCEFRDVVQQLREKGQSISKAVLVHNPGEPGEVIDDLLTRIRHGNF